MIAFLFPALGGSALALCWPTFGWWGLGWISLIPVFLFAARASSVRSTALIGLVTGFFFHAVALHWIYLTCRFALVPIPVSFLAWLALSAFLGLNWAVAVVLGRTLAASSPSFLRPWAWALAWTSVAVFTERWGPRPSIDLLAYSQWPNLSLIQAGSWGGPHLVGVLVVAVNAALAEAWDKKERSIAALALPLALTALVWGHGARVLFDRSADRGPSARVEILQPCVDQYHKWNAEFVREIIDGFAELVARPRPEAPALVVWPETAIPRWGEPGRPYAEAASAAAATKSPQLVGAIIRGPDGLGRNAIQLVGADGGVAGLYEKRELVPFGEFVPGRSLIPRVLIDNWLGILDDLGDMGAGAPDQPLLSTVWGPAAATICYEAMFPRWARRDAARGAKLLINITNDGWYKNTWGPHQHFGASVFRAIENRIPVIRSGNTGISAVIDPWGVITHKLTLNEKGRLDGSIPLSDSFPRRSVYARHGDWLGVLCLLLIVPSLLLSFLFRP